MDNRDLSIYLSIKSITLLGTRDSKRLLRVKVGQGAPSGPVEGDYPLHNARQSCFFVLPLSSMLEASRNWTKPTLFVHALDLLSSD